MEDRWLDEEKVFYQMTDGTVHCWEDWMDKLLDPGPS